jgi:hypothetical protein
MGIAMYNRTMTLYRYGVRLGILTGYSYETPWASAWLVAEAPELVERYAAIAAFLAWSAALSDDLPDAEADARYEQELVARGLNEALIEGWWGGWQIQLDNEAVYEDISLYDLQADGWVTWRW